MSAYTNGVVQEILDGKRKWTIDEIPGAEFDLFTVTKIQPLRELAAKGCFTINEHKESYRGEKMTDEVRIVGDVNQDLL